MCGIKIRVISSINITSRGSSKKEGVLARSYESTRVLESLFDGKSDVRHRWQNLTRINKASKNYKSVCWISCTCVPCTKSINWTPGFLQDRNLWGYINFQDIGTWNVMLKRHCKVIASWTWKDSGISRDYAVTKNIPHGESEKEKRTSFINFVRCSPIHLVCYHLKVLFLNWNWVHHIG